MLLDRFRLDQISQSSNDNLSREKGQEFVSIYFVHQPTEDVYYLKMNSQDRDSSYLEGKLLGFFGKIEQIDKMKSMVTKIPSVFEASKRLILEEEFKFNFEKNQTLVYGGYLIDHLGRPLHYLKCEVKDRLPSNFLSTTRAIGEYYPKKHHIEKQEDFPYHFTLPLTKLFNSIPFEDDIRDFDLRVFINNL